MIIKIQLWEMLSYHIQNEIKMISLNRMRLITDVVVRLTVDSAATTTTNTVLPLTVQ